MHWQHALTAISLVILFAGCGNEELSQSQVDHSSDTVAESATGPDAFLENLRALCGRAFEGRRAGPSATDPELAAETLVMHVRRCTDDEIQIPLHIESDRSRTWLLTRTESGLRLKHDHREPDGSDSANSQYGGDTIEPGTAAQQRFPADAFTADLIPEAATNIWTMTIQPGESFSYHLTRHGAPRAAFEFDLADEVEPPPAPWGYEGT